MNNPDICVPVFINGLDEDKILTTPASQWYGGLTHSRVNTGLRAWPREWEWCEHNGTGPASAETDFISEQYLVLYKV